MSSGLLLLAQCVNGSPGRVYENNLPSAQGCVYCIPVGSAGSQPGEQLSKAPPHQWLHILSATFPAFQTLSPISWRPGLGRELDFSGLSLLSDCLERRTYSLVKFSGKAHGPWARAMPVSFGLLSLSSGWHRVNKQSGSLKLCSFTWKRILFEFIIIWFINSGCYFTFMSLGVHHWLSPQKSPNWIRTIV